MHITAKYNQDVLYTDELVEAIRQHYYPQISWRVGHSREEHANLDRLFLFDMSQNFVLERTLLYLGDFATEVNTHNPQPTSLWSSLACAQSKAELDTFNDAKANAMIWIYSLYAKMDHTRTFIEMIEAAEQLCRHRNGLKSRLAECLRDKGDRYRYLGKIAEAETCLREGLAICQELGDDEQKAFVNLYLSDCSIRRGDLTEVTALLDLPESYFDPTYQAWTDVLINRSQVALLQGNFDQARNDISCAMENDKSHHGDRRRLEILNWEANVEARASATQEAEILFAEVTAAEILPGQPDFMQLL